MWREQRVSFCCYKPSRFCFCYLTQTSGSQALTFTCMRTTWRIYNTSCNPFLGSTVRVPEFCGSGVSVCAFSRSVVVTKAFYFWGGKRPLWRGGRLGNKKKKIKQSNKQKRQHGSWPKFAFRHGLQVWSWAPVPLKLSVPFVTCKVCWHQLNDCHCLAWVCAFLWVLSDPLHVLVFLLHN